MGQIMLSKVKNRYMPLQTANLPARSLTSVNTIEELRYLDLTPVAALDAVYVKGYYQPGDHGGGVFVWFPQMVIAIDRDGDGIDEAPDDFGGTVLAPISVTSAAQAGRWVRSFDGSTLHTLWFGIVSNRNQGTDISERLNLAIKRACTLAYNGTNGGANSYNPGITLEIDPGKYDIRNTIQLPQPMTQTTGANGSGATDLVIKGCGERTQIFWTGNDSTKVMMRLSNYKNTEIRDLQLINTSTSRGFVELINDIGGPTPTGLRLTRLLLTSYVTTGQFNGKAVNFGIFFNSMGQENDKNNDLAVLQDVRVTHTNFAYVLTGFNCHDIIFDHCSMAFNNVGLYANPGFLKWYNGFATENLYTDFFISNTAHNVAIVGHNSEHSGRLIQTGICEGTVALENVRFESNKTIAGCAVAVAAGTIFSLRNSKIGAGDSTRVHYYSAGGYPYELMATTGKNMLIEQCFFGYRKGFAYTDDFVQDASGLVQFEVPAASIDFNAATLTLVNNHGFLTGQAVTVMSGSTMNLPKMFYLSFDINNPNLCRLCRTYSEAISRINYLPLTNNIYGQPVRLATLACPISISLTDWAVTIGAATPVDQPSQTSALQSVMLMTPTFAGVKSTQLTQYFNKVYSTNTSRIIHSESNNLLSANYQAKVARLKNVRGPSLITLSLNNNAMDSISFIYSSAAWMNTTSYYILPVFFASDQALTSKIQLLAKLSRTNNFYNTQFTEVELVIKCNELPTSFHQSFLMALNSLAGLQLVNMDVERIKPVAVTITNAVPLGNTLGLLSDVQPPIVASNETITQKIPVNIAGQVYYLLASQ
jgi:hypothetical protein